MLRHKRNVHMKEKYIDPLLPVVKSTNMTFKHPFSMVVSGPSGSRKSVWTKNYSCPPLYNLHRSVSYGATDNGNPSTITLGRE